MKTTKLRLTVDVEYAPNGVTTEELKDMLNQLVVDALNYGGFTGDTPATVECYSYDTVEIN